MTTHEHHKAAESWRYYRSAYSRRSHHVPTLAIFGPLIDRIGALGYFERLYASASLDNLVISVRPEPRDRRQTILVVPQEDAVEFRLYAEDGEVEVSTVARDQVESAIETLLPRLIVNPKTSSNGTAERGSAV